MLKKYSLFFLFAFFFAGIKSPALAGVHEKAGTIYQGPACQLSENLFNSAHFPFHSPLESNEEEPANEEELKDNVDDARHLMVLKNLAYSISNTSNTVKSNFYQRVHAIQNRSTVPLFILFLSWKSFLI